MNPDSIPRREALRRLVALAGGAAAGVAIPRDLAGSDTLERVGLHLGTVRDRLDADFAGSLREIALLGYQEVEFAGYHGRDPEEVRRALRAAGLEAPAAHVSFRTMMSDWERAIVAAHAIGHRYLVVESIPSNRRQSPGDYRRAANLFNRAAATASVAGMGFAYRNGASDFEPMEDRTPFDVLLEETDPDRVHLEMDLQAVWRGGGDPVESLERHPGRVHLLHLTDMGAGGESVPAGEGTPELARILGLRRVAGIRHFLVAGDAGTSPEVLRASREHLRNLQFETRDA